MTTTLTPALTAEQARERLIIALDVPTATQARQLVERLDGCTTYYKIGLELCMSPGYFELMAELKQAGYKVFADLKLHDIGRTVERSLRVLAEHQPDLVTVHADPAVAAAAKRVTAQLGAEHPMQVIAVTVLTSLSQAEVELTGVSKSIDELVPQRAAMAVQHGCDGVVASAQEAARIRGVIGADPIIVTPGIRLDTDDKGDQTRAVTPKQALRNGSDYLVVGSPITRAEDPVAQAQRFLAEMEG